MEKRGFALGFNWIFVLVSGVVILLVAAVFVVQFSAYTKERARTKTLTHLDNALLSLQNTPGFFSKTVVFPKTVSLKAGCGTISLDGSAIRSDTLIFAPGTLTGREILLGHEQIWPGVDLYYMALPSEERNPTATKQDLFSVSPSNPAEGQGFLSEEVFFGSELSRDEQKTACIQEQIFERSLEQIRILTAKAELLQKRVPSCNYQSSIISLERLEQAALKRDVSVFRSEKDIFLSLEQELGGCPGVQ